jgi:hypothetical protein
MQPTIPQPSLSGHLRMTREVNCRTINAALANRDRRRTEEEWIMCPDSVMRRRDQLKWIVLIQP